jgi:hypothetical protein
MEAKGQYLILMLKHLKIMKSCISTSLLKEKLSVKRHKTTNESQVVKKHLSVVVEEQMRKQNT